MPTRREFLTAAASTALQRPARPNILLLFPDQWRHDWLGGAPGLSVRTPNLDKLTARGVRFNQAVVASPLCAPSRACLASGKEYDRCRVSGNNRDYPLDQRTYYTLLRDSGYHVAGCGKLDLHKATRDWGLDGRRLLPEWGFSDGIDNAGKMDAIASGHTVPKDPYMAYLHREGLAAAHVADFRRRSSNGQSYSLTDPTPLPESAYCDNWVAANGLELMKRSPKGKPWHLAVNFTGPHPPVDITARMEKLCRGLRVPQPNGNQQFSPEKHTAIRQNYSAMIENIDRWVGVYVGELERRGELESTLIVFSSDHGEMLGDHGRWGKTVPYQPSVGVPLIVAGPGVKQGVRSDALVSIMDLAATFLDYAGIPRRTDMDSRSFRPLLEGKTDKHRGHVLSGLGAWRMVYDGRHKLIRNFTPDPMLFDLQDDPRENVNIAERSRGEVSRLERLLT